MELYYNTLDEDLCLTYDKASILKCKMIVMRTSIETCYERVLNRWKSLMKEYKEEEYLRYV